MILSHRHRFLFLKTNKTAGTSVEIALSRHCGPDDVITPLVPEDEAKRRELGGRGPQNHLAPWTDYSFRDWRRRLRGKPKPRFWHHITAAEAKPHIPDEVWDGCFKFCVERNPWDRVVSLYYWRCKTEPRPTIEEFLASDVPLALKQRGRDVYTLDGQVVVDRVLRFEDLDAELESVRQQLGLPGPLTLPRAKGSFRKDKRSYRDILGPAERDRIAELFADEIAMMGYEF